MVHILTFSARSCLLGDRQAWSIGDGTLRFGATQVGDASCAGRGAWVVAGSSVARLDLIVCQACPTLTQASAATTLLASAI